MTTVKVRYLVDDVDAAAAGEFLERSYVVTLDGRVQRMCHRLRGKQVVEVTTK